MGDPGTTPAGTPKSKGVDFWMIAGYLAFTYKQQVDDWQMAADQAVAKLEAAGVELRTTVESGVDGYEQQISDLTGALEAAETQGGISAAQLQETRQLLAETQAELESTSGDLDDAQQELAATQAELDDANARLEQLGELVLPNGIYEGPVLGARVEPTPAIVFQDGTAWRVAEVAQDVAITPGGQSLTLEEFSALLQSTDLGDVELANGPYEVVVKKGLVTSISTAET